MTLSTKGYAWRSFLHYLRPNLALAMAVAAATAVLVGALVVGSSMRGSLRELTLDRLAGVDEILVGDHFFSQQLVEKVRASEAFQKNYRAAAPVIFFPTGTAETKQRDRLQRSSNVNVLGLDDSLWGIQTAVDGKDYNARVVEDQVVINRALADELGIGDADVEGGTALITLRIPKPTAMPSESALGEKDDLVDRLVDLRVTGILENQQLGRFAVEPSQQLPRNVFVSLKVLQGTLSRNNALLAKNPEVINAIFLAGKDPLRPPSETTSRELLNSLTPATFDLGVAVNRIKLASGKEPSQVVAHEYVSLATSRLVFSPEQAAALRTRLSNADPMSTYLVNRMRKAEGDDARPAIPYSMVTAIQIGDAFQPISALTQSPIKAPQDDEIVLNEWAANDLGAKVGDVLELEFFEPESTHGIQRVQTARLKLADIAQLTVPSEPFAIRRRELIPAVYDSPPTIANDPQLTPEVPGLSDSDSIENWDLPFKLEYPIRAQDDDYWNSYRTTPKGFVNLATGKKLWNSRFGWETGFRLKPSVTVEEVENVLVDLWRANPSQFGLDLVPVKRTGLKASSGTTPFDALFLALSLFIIASALLLVSVLFRLGIEQRVEQLGLLSAIGFPGGKMMKMWLGEALLVCLLGGFVGVGLGVLYGAGVIYALKTLWVGAIATPFLNLHVDPISLPIGLVCGLFTSMLTIGWSVRRFVRESPRDLLAGVARLNRTTARVTRRSRWLGWLGFAALAGATVLAIAATQLGGEAQAGAFMGGGFLVLVSLWLLLFRALRDRKSKPTATTLGIGRMSLENLRRNPVRSILIVGLVSVATFLIVAISSFRLQPTERSTGGAAWIARSSVPILKDLNSAEGQRDLLADKTLPPGSEVFSLRLKPGQDASCNNLYQSTQPRVLGIPQAWIDRFDSESQVNFLWSGQKVENDAERQNPWRMLERKDSDRQAIPAVLDKNTAMYSLKIYSTGTEFTVRYDSGEQVTFRVVGFLENSIFQGSVLVGENDFVKTFPGLGGYREFLISGPANGEAEEAILDLENRLGDFGFDVTRSRDVLTQFAAVQNTYLNAFQSLGGLGLLLGTFGLAAVQLRNILERRKELALMQAIGFSPRRLTQLLFGEQMVLLATGLAVGVLAALAATVPHWLTGSASLPVLSLIGILLLVVAIGLVAAALSARRVLKLPLAATLKDT
ncbi:MAG: ABC transporter permease [Pirellulaceae bacterium]